MPALAVPAAPDTSSPEFDIRRRGGPESYKLKPYGFVSHGLMRLRLRSRRLRKRNQQTVIKLRASRHRSGHWRYLDDAEGSLRDIRLARVAEWQRDCFAIQ